MVPPAQITWDDVAINDKLGSGAFGTVFRVKVSNNQLLSCPGDTTTGSSDSTETEASSSLLSLLPGTSYALKTGRENNDKDDLEALGVEAEILLHLSNSQQHENIITLRAISSDFWENPAKGFIVMDCLSDVLDQRLSRWRQTQRKQESFMSCLPFFRVQKQRRSSKSQHHQKQIGRSILVGVGLARALHFLHKNRILHRDVKPSNVGFDRDGNVRLFDFGLSRFYNGETKHGGCNENDEGHSRKLTAMVGALRYMAPEVMAGKQEYELSADVYSYAVLLWEVYTLERPFGREARAASSPSHFCELALKCRLQSLSLRGVVHSGIKEILSKSLCHDPQQRPAFEYIFERLL